jgi:hypothetical protein
LSWRDAGLLWKHYCLDICPRSVRRWT